MARERKKSSKSATPPALPTASDATGSGKSGVLPSGYVELLDDLKTRIRTAQVKASLAANRELILLYWSIGRDILARQTEQGWGAKVIDRLSADLRRAFSGLQGLSPRNLKYMRLLAESYPSEQFVQQAAAQIPWFHNILILEKLKTHTVREWYIRQTVANGWSRNVLALQIESKLHERQGQAVHNFDRTLPKPDSDLAAQLLKDPYTFDFLTLAADAREREVEVGLLAHIRQFMLELGAGFAFVGSQYRLEVAGEEFFLDLLFYHCKLHCYFVIDLKMGEFQPEHAGKMNFYLSAVDEQVRDKDRDGPTLGLILCRRQNRLIAEYALRDMGRPIGVSGFETKLVESLPAELATSFPSVEELERELASYRPVDPHPPE